VSGSLRPARLILAIAVALLVAYAAIWAQVSRFDVGRSDFTAFYVGGTLLREGHTGDLYSQAVQQPLHSALIAPDPEANLPFVNTPVAAALVLPATFLPLDTAYRLWSLLELAVLLIAIVLAIRSVEWPQGTPRIWQASAGAAALAGLGTWTTFMQAQWTPLLALGLVLAYRSWKGGHQATGAALLVLSAGIAKPHLALGLLAFLLGWRRRRIILGALAGAAGLAVASLGLVGPSGVAGFVAILASSTTRWELSTMVSFIGVVGSVFGNGLPSHLIGAIASLLACAAAVWLGTRVRHELSRLDTALAGAAVLSLVASPHAYPDDLVMLAPALVFGVAAAARSVGSNAPLTLTSPVALVFGAWALITLAACADLVDGASFPPGQLAGWALVLAAGLACVATGQHRRLAGVTRVRVAGLGGAQTRS
jgi:Glycosyltransferase family 87